MVNPQARAALARLKRQLRYQAAAENLAALCGIVPLEGVPHGTRDLLASLLFSDDAPPDPVEQRLAEVEALAAARSGLPIGLKELPNGDGANQG